MILTHVLLTLSEDSFYRLEISLNDINLCWWTSKKISLNPGASFIVEMSTPNIVTTLTAIFTRAMLTVLYITLFGIRSVTYTHPTPFVFFFFRL